MSYEQYLAASNKTLWQHIPASERGYYFDRLPVSDAEVEASRGVQDAQAHLVQTLQDPASTAEDISIARAAIIGARRKVYAQIGRPRATTLYPNFYVTDEYPQTAIYGA